MRDANPWVHEWDDLSRRERIYLGVIYGFLQVVVALLMLISALTGDVPRWFGLAAGIAGVAAFFMAARHLQRFRCPRCAEAFADPYAGPGVSCVHCHVRRGESVSAGIELETEFKARRT